MPNWDLDPEPPLKRRLPIPTRRPKTEGVKRIEDMTKEERMAYTQTEEGGGRLHDSACDWCHAKGKTCCMQPGKRVCSVCKVRVVACLVRGVKITEKSDE